MPTNNQGIFLLVLNGEDAGYLTSVDFPTDTLLTLEFGFSSMSRATYEWIGKSLTRQTPMSGCIIAFDFNLRPAYFDVWDLGYINQIVFPGLDAALSQILKLKMAVRISNLRQADSVKHRMARGDGRRRDPLTTFCFQVKMGDKSYFVAKASAISVSLGANLAGQFTGAGSDLILTMGESIAADFRSWKQARDARDLTINYQDTAFNVVGSIQYAGATVKAIHPAAPLNPHGTADVTISIGHIKFNYPL